MASEDLLRWCREHGVSCHGIRSGFVAEGWRGVIATQDLEPDTCVLRVPQPLLLTAHSAQRDPLLRAVLDRAGTSLSSSQVLTVHLLHEASKGESSFWWPYLRSLPHSYTTAMCFRAVDIEGLQVPYAQQAVEAAVEAALGQWRGALPTLRALCLAPKWLTKQAWLWAASTISSRTMYVPFDPAGALTPFGDLHNFAPPPPPYTPRLSVLRGRQLLSAQQQGQRAHDSPAAYTLKQPSIRMGLSQSAAQSYRSKPSQPGSAALAGQLGTMRIHRPLSDFSRQPPAQQKAVAHAVPSSTGDTAVDAGGGEGLEGVATTGREIVAGSGSCSTPQPCTASAAGVASPQEQLLGTTAGLPAAEPLGRTTALEWGKDSCGATQQVVQLEHGQAPRTAEAVAGASNGSLSPSGSSCTTSNNGSCAPASWAAERGPGGVESRGQSSQAAAEAELQEEHLCGDGCFDEAAGEYRIFVRRRYLEGEQVMLCYGRHTNLALCEHYGFVLASNPHDTALLPAHLLPPEVIAQLPSGDEEGGCYLHADGAPSWALLRALRLAGATPAERKSGAYLALQQDVPISAISESRALGMLRRACQAVLSTLPSTAQQDEALSEERGQALGECGRLAVEWRLGYKRILLLCGALCEEALRGLGSVH